MSPTLVHAFVAACGFLASAGFMRFVLRRPAQAKSDVRTGR
ncbi:MAG TPA: hypothetical protein VG248_02655 [Caulobacteraceae bacterium]|jgi:hypothetical protein|nr:hypothetical protein [Caulobacteraceae bacterium]